MPQIKDNLCRIGIKTNGLYSDKWLLREILVIVISGFSANNKNKIRVYLLDVGIYLYFDFCRVVISFYQRMYFIDKHKSIIIVL